jgi:hypothetical protein
VLVVLVKDGEVGLPEQYVLPRVADGELVFDFLVEVVGGVLGFPEAVVGSSNAPSAFASA